MNETLENETPDKKSILKRLLHIRGKILSQYPFYGQLLMHLNMGIANCETAYTDTKNIVFDPCFVNRLSDIELMFLMNHEVLHCVLGHCTRGKVCQQDLFNVACDIVINSMLLQEMQLTNFTVDGKEPIHLTPFLQEGREYNAEQVYEMFVKSMESKIINNKKNQQKVDEDSNGSVDMSGFSKNAIDRHDKWQAIENPHRTDVIWDRNVLEASQSAMCSNCTLTQSIRELIENIQYKSKLNWKEILQDFVQLSYDNYDYSFSPPDNRFFNSDFAIPSFGEVPQEALKNIWFAVDTSASVDKNMLSDVYSELKQAMNQIPSLSGFISFFDGVITMPQSFSKVEDLEQIKPVGGGGTSFYIIFDLLHRMLEQEIDCEIQEKPVAIVIMTDGYASFPPEEKSLCIPVLWIINNSEVKPPWGKVVYM